jgi:predicted RNase H-like HicB family nuclease
MHKEFAAILEQDGDWFIAYSPEIPGANGQDHTQEEALKSLADAIDLILTDRLHDVLHGLPEDAIQTTVLVA